MGLWFKSFKYFACVILRPRCEAIVKRHAWLVDWIASYCQDTWQLLVCHRLPSKFRACRKFHVDKSCRNTLFLVCPRCNPILSRVVISNKNRLAMRLIRALQHSFSRQILCFLNPYFKLYDVTINFTPWTFNEFPTGNAKIFRHFISAVFIFNLGKKTARTYRPVECRSGISNVADLGPAL